MKISTLFVFLLFLVLVSCKDEPQVSRIKNENFQLKQAIDLGDFTPLGVAKFKHYLFISDTINEVVLRYNSQNDVMDTIFNGKAGYITCENSRAVLPDLDSNRIRLYRGEPNLYNLKVNADLVRPISFTAKRVDDFFLLDQSQNLIIKNDRGVYSAIDGKDVSDRLIMPSMVVLFKNQLLVSDTGNKRIMVYDNTGVFQFSFGEDILERPTGIATNGELIFVCDTVKKEILIFNNMGEYQFSFNGGLADPTAVFSEGNLLVVSDKAKEEIKLFDRVFSKDQ